MRPPLRTHLALIGILLLVPGAPEACPPGGARPSAAASGRAEERGPAAMAGERVPNPPAVIPGPQRYERLPGSVRFSPSAAGLKLSVRDSAGVLPAIEEICSTFVGMYGGLPGLGEERPVMIRAGITGVDPLFDRRCRARRIVPGDSLGREGYMLLVGEREVLVAARETPGLFYGLQTLNQLLRGAAPAGGVLGAMRIMDWPDMQVRGIMDDISRGPVPTPAYFRLQIRRLAGMKVNAVSYYTEHMVATQSHPEFAPPGAALTIQEWKDLARFARRYHIDLVGGFQSFGHFDKILAHPRYAHLAEGKSMLSPAFEESYTLLGDIYGEMVPAFSAPFFMTHCDETFDLGKGASKKLVDSLGIGKVYAGHILRLHDMLHKLGVRMMIWGDVLLEHPEVIDRIPRDVVIGSWTYDTLAEYHRYIRPFQSRGFDVLVTPGVLNSFSVLPNFRVSMANVERFVRDGIANNVRGAMVTVWDDGGNALFARDWYGVAFAADRMWHCDTADQSYDLRFDPALYGDRVRGASRGIRHLLQLTDLTPTDGLYERSIWSPVIPEPGRTLRLNVLEWDRVLALARGADSLFRSGRPLTEQGDLEALRFSANLFEGAARLRLGVLEASRLYGRAVEGQNKPGPEIRTDLVKALGILGSLESEFTALKSRYAALWLAESRLHALDSIERSYDTMIAGLRDAGRRVRGALEAMETGAVLPGPAEVRLAVQESNGWYFRDWLITGPISGPRLDADRLAGMGGERDAAPSVTQEFLSDSITYRWKRLSVQNPEVDLRTEYAAARGATAYAYATLESPSARTVRALIGAGGPLRLFVNGVQAFEQREGDSLAVDAHQAELPLQRGKNRLLFKVCGGESGAWGFSFQLPGSEVRGRKNRYRIER